MNPVMLEVGKLFPVKELVCGRVYHADDKELPGLPTVLTPELDETLSENYKSCEDTVKIFDIGHVYLSGKDGKKPMEKIALSIGGLWTGNRCKELQGIYGEF